MVSRARPRSRTVAFSFWAAGLAVAAIVVFNVQGWLVLSRTSRVLEAELGDRLEAVATTLSAALAGKDSIDQALLAQVMRENELLNVFLVDDRLEYRLNLRQPELAGESDAALELDMPEILGAFAGIATQSRLYRAAGYYLKTAYAPVEGASGAVEAVLGVEADATFFSVVTGFRRSLFAANLLSLVAIAAVVLVAFSLLRHAFRVEQAASRANTLALMGQMSAAVAHEIKNPLAIIRAAAERLRKRYDPGSDPTFDYITGEVDRLAAAVSNYLGVGAYRPAEIQPLDLGTLLAEVVRDLEPEAQRHGVALALDGPAAEPGRVAGSRNELRQVFLNLVLNGIQAQPSGGTVELTGATERRGSRTWAVVRVKDSGPGIEPRVLAKVWEPFYTTRDKGSGLGLFVVRRIVEAHRGKVSITSAPGAGATVEVRLPMKESKG